MTVKFTPEVRSKTPQVIDWADFLYTKTETFGYPNTTSICLLIVIFKPPTGNHWLNNATSILFSNVNLQKGTYNRLLRQNPSSNKPLTISTVKSSNVPTENLHIYKLKVGKRRFQRLSLLPKAAAWARTLKRRAFAVDAAGERHKASWSWALFFFFWDQNLPRFLLEFNIFRFRFWIKCYRVLAVGNCGFKVDVGGSSRLLPLLDPSTWLQVGPQKQPKGEFVVFQPVPNASLEHGSVRS